MKNQCCPQCNYKKWNDETKEIINACGWTSCSCHKQLQVKEEKPMEWAIDLESIVFQMDCGEKESNYFLEQLKNLFSKTLALKKEQQIKEERERIRGEIEKLPYRADTMGFRLDRDEILSILKE